MGLLCEDVSGGTILNFQSLLQKKQRKQNQNKTHHSVCPLYQVSVCKVWFEDKIL